MLHSNVNEADRLCKDKTFVAVLLNALKNPTNPFLVYAIRLAGLILDANSQQQLSQPLSRSQVSSYLLQHTTTFEGGGSPLFSAPDTLMEYLRLLSIIVASLRFSPPPPNDAQAAANANANATGEDDVKTASNVVQTIKALLQCTFTLEGVSHHAVAVQCLRGVAQRAVASPMIVPVFEIIVASGVVDDTCKVALHRLKSIKDRKTFAEAVKLLASLVHTTAPSFRFPLQSCPFRQALPLEARKLHEMISTCVASTITARAPGFLIAMCSPLCSLLDNFPALPASSPPPSRPGTVTAATNTPPTAHLSEIVLEIMKVLLEVTRVNESAARMAAAQLSAALWKFVISAGMPAQNAVAASAAATMVTGTEALLSHVLLLLHVLLKKSTECADNLTSNKYVKNRGNRRRAHHEIFLRSHPRESSNTQKVIDTLLGLLPGKRCFAYALCCLCGVMDNVTSKTEWVLALILRPRAWGSISSAVRQFLTTPPTCTAETSEVARVEGTTFGYRWTGSGDPCAFLLHSLARFGLGPGQLCSSGEIAPESTWCTVLNALLHSSASFSPIAHAAALSALTTTVGPSTIARRSSSGFSAELIALPIVRQFADECAKDAAAAAATAASATAAAAVGEEGPPMDGGLRVAVESGLVQYLLLMLEEDHLQRVCTWPDLQCGGNVAKHKLLVQVLAILYLPFATTVTPSLLAVVLEAMHKQGAVACLLRVLKHFPPEELEVPMNLLSRLVLTRDDFIPQFIDSVGLASCPLPLLLDANKNPSAVLVSALLIVSHLARLSSSYYKFLHDAGVEATLPALLSHSDPNVRSKACNFVGNLFKHSAYCYKPLSNDGVIEKLIDLCGDADCSTRKFACFAVGNAAFHSCILYPKLRAAIPALVALLNDTDEKTCANAAGALGNLIRNSDMLSHELVKEHAVESVVRLIVRPQQSGDGAGAATALPSVALLRSALYFIANSVRTSATRQALATTPFFDALVQQRLPEHPDETVRKHVARIERYRQQQAAPPPPPSN
eukprot:TRINITY_DN2522_c1_g1_i1.p1 TRINITY_DN2522_c1_g1~~TRINITY_DN2522_c1_g1_i1.p1  ORF type:complete len:1015 (+),score=238.89 TRINITY_DN2522_c1_g1_i1:542-3586(+)